MRNTLLVDKCYNTSLHISETSNEITKTNPVVSGKGFRIVTKTLYEANCKISAETACQMAN